jgi:hypothetical protein
LFAKTLPPLLLGFIQGAVAAPPHSNLVADSQGWKSKSARFSQKPTLQRRPWPCGFIFSNITFAHKGEWGL